MNIVLRVLTAPSRFLRRLYDWTLHWAKTPKARAALFGIAFMESSFFPIPPDVLLIAMTLAKPRKWLGYAALCTLGSLTGALLGYAIGFGLYETVGQWIVTTYHLEQAMELVGRRYQENAFLAVFTAAFTPIPYKVFTIAGGLFRINLATLLGASLVGRFGRFFLVAASLRLFGRRIGAAIERYFDIFSLVFTALLIGGFFILKHVLK
ncbi:MAG: YqaA family protein [Deltaproteobacteria bacterium]